MCGAPQLASQFGDVTVPIGEVAHQVGATDGAKSPRGAGDLSMTARADEENLMLLCHGCHRKIDSTRGENIYTVDILKGIKSQHEAMVAALTDFRSERRTLVLSTRSTVRQQPVGASPQEIAFALAESRRTPYVLGNLTYRIEIDLRDPVSDEWVWARGMKEIDRAVAQISTDVASERVDHVSVFALAPVPLLAYLGHKLGDKWPLDVFRPSREQTDRRWCWGSPPDHVPAFTIDLPSSDPDTSDMVVAIDVSGPVRTERLPEGIAGLPVARVHPAGRSTGHDLLDSPAAVDAFAASWRNLMSSIENDHSHVARLHVAAAVPAPAAVAIGRFHRPHIDPTLVLYELDDTTHYTPALEIPA